MALLVGLLVAVTVIVLVMRAAASPSGGSVRRQRPPRPTRTQRPQPLAPDDDPEFLRELQRRTRRDDPTA
jgi:hypothetical protein